MATFHCSIKSGKKGSAAPHAAYIARLGRHGKDGDHDLVAAGHGNLPSWAKNDPLMFWRMADKHERSNGAAYREYELALPGELTRDQNVELVREFIADVLPGKSFQFAIHQPIAALGGIPQPHAHLMFSDRRVDEIDRPGGQHFRRFNPSHPERGGCQKDSGGMNRGELRREVEAVRSKWADLQNAALEANGFDDRVDSRSNRARGIERMPERHIGPVGVKKMSQEQRDEYLAARNVQL